MGLPDREVIYSLVSRLNPEDREELYNTFSEDFRFLSKTARYYMATGIRHLSDENIVKAIEGNERIFEWVLKRLKEVCKSISELETIYEGRE